MPTSACVKSEMTSYQSVVAQRLTQKMSGVGHDSPCATHDVCDGQSQANQVIIHLRQDATTLWSSPTGLLTVTWNCSAVAIMSTSIWAHEVVVVGAAVLKSWAYQLSTVFARSPFITCILVLCPLVDTLAILTRVLVCHLAAVPVLTDKVCTGPRTATGWVRTWYVRGWGPGL